MRILRRSLFSGMAALFLLLGGSGCAGLPWNEAARNLENAKQLKIGMTKNEVLEVMGEPVADETFCKPDVWYYFVRSIWMDGLTTEDECMPLVFEDGVLIGWGQPFYAGYRAQRKKGDQPLE